MTSSAVKNLDRTSMMAAGSDGSAKMSPYQYSFNEDGWELVFEAMPTTAGTPGGSPLIGIRSTGKAQVVDNKSGLRRVLNTKANKYGTILPFPLVTAILSNTTFPT